MRETCGRCGKLKNVRYGTWTTWGGRYSTPQFFCNRCLRKMEKEEAKKRLQPFLQIAQEYGVKPLTQADKINVLVQILKKMCHQSGWFKLMDITKTYESELHRGAVDVRRVSRLLNTLGFTRRARKKAGSYTYVFVNTQCLEEF